MEDEGFVPAMGLHIIYFQGINQGGVLQKIADVYRIIEFQEVHPPVFFNYVQGSFRVGMVYFDTVDLVR